MSVTAANDRPATGGPGLCAEAPESLAGKFCAALRMLVGRLGCDKDVLFQVGLRMDARILPSAAPAGPNPEFSFCHLLPQFWLPNASAAGNCVELTTKVMIVL